MSVQAAEEEIRKEALKMAERGSITMPPMDREQRRAVERAMREVDTDWRGGKSIQRRQMLVLMPMVWRALYRLKLDQKAPDNPASLADPSYPGGQKFAASAAQDIVMSFAREREAGITGPAHDAIAAAIHTTLYPIWSYMKASQLSDPNVFRMREQLVEKLMNTDIGNVRPQDVRLPFPGLYVSLPHGERILELRNTITGLHEITLIAIAEGRNEDGERTLFSVFWGEPRSDSSSAGDDHVYSFGFTLPEGGPDILRAMFEATDEYDAEQIERGDVEIAGFKDAARFYGESFDFLDSRALLRRFLVNFCLYLNSPNLDIEPTKGGQKSWGDAVVASRGPKRTKVRVSKSRRSSKKQKAKGGRFTEWDVGRKVEKLKRRSSTTDILVRGHFRNQAHGPGRTLRKVIWIEPFIRLPTEPDISPGHEYEVEPNV